MQPIVKKSRLPTTKHSQTGTDKQRLNPKPVSNDSESSEENNSINRVPPQTSAPIKGPKPALSTPRDILNGESQPDHVPQLDTGGLHMFLLDHISAVEANTEKRMPRVETQESEMKEMMKILVASPNSNSSDCRMNSSTPSKGISSKRVKSSLWIYGRTAV